MKNYYSEYFKKNPFKKILNTIKTRCENLNADNYKHYGKRGIKCLISEEELKFLWFRDKAYNMKKPSIDREDSNKNYTLKNCQFIELSINAGKDKKIPVFQYDLENNFIKEWESEQDVIKGLKLKSRHIHEVALGKRNTAHGFLWKYK